MKKIILTITTIAIALTSFAQKNKVLSAYNYNKAFERSQKCSELSKGIEAINLARSNDATKGWAKTWYYRGNLYFNILASKDEECKNIDKNALEECTDSYMKTLLYNFEDEELKNLDLEKEADVMKFFTALQSKSKMSDEMYTADIIGRRLPGLAGEYSNKGINQFQEKDYKGAQESFGKSMMLNQLTGKLDTISLYNVALASELSGDNETAKTTYNALIQLKYNLDGNGADLYRSLAKIYKNEGDTVKALECVKKGREAYPNNNNLIVEELEYYLQTGKDQEALQNLNTAIANDPKNPILHFALGTVYENLKEGDKAVAAYNKALEIDPNYFDAAFNLGTYYFNQGAEKVNTANQLPLSKTKEFDALNKEAKTLFEKAVPPIEKAHELKPGDVDTANMLIKLYTRTEQYDKAKVIKAKFK